MGDKSREDKVKEDIIGAVTDDFEPTEFSWEWDRDKDILIATEFADDGEELARYAVSLTIDLDKL
jgi:hypothetical protein